VTATETIGFNSVSERDNLLYHVTTQGYENVVWRNTRYLPETALRRDPEVSNPYFPKLTHPSDLTLAGPRGTAMMFANARASEKTLFDLPPLVSS